jgi:hypothetical protein
MGRTISEEYGVGAALIDPVKRLEKLERRARREI